MVTGSGNVRNLRETSPISIIYYNRQRQHRKFRRLRKWKHAAANWLNGLPVRAEDEFDSGSVKNELPRPPPPAAARERKSTVASSINPRNWFRRRRREGAETDAEAATATAAPPAPCTLAIEAPTSSSNNNSDSNLNDKQRKSLTLLRPSQLVGKVVEGEETLQRDEPVRIIQLPPEPFGVIPRGHRNDDLYSTTVSNEVLTAKYTVLNFLPKNILEQLRRVANVYFVAIIILQCIPAVSNYSPILAASPVIAIMAVTAIKDAIEDWRRHQQDNDVNYSTCWSLHRPESGPVIIRDTRYQRFVNLMWSLRDRFILTTTRWYCRLKKRPFRLEGRYRKLPCLPTDAVAWQETFWRDIRVGDLILLRNNEMIPADVVLLSSSEPDGVCFVETKNLDGETNLKLKKSPYETSWIQTAEDAFYLKATVEVELPHVNLYSFTGKVIIAKDFEEDEPVVRKGDEAGDTLGADVEDGSDDQLGDNGQTSVSLYGGATSSDKLLASTVSTPPAYPVLEDSKETFGFVEPTILPIGSENLLLRGCILRNTPFAIGVVAYTGPHTKLMLNSGGTPSKRTRIERQMNPQIILIFALLFIICLSCAIVQAQFSSSSSNAPYWISSFQDGIMTSSAFLGFLTFFSSLILFQTLVPISMYVTLEMVKTVQAYFINNDACLYHLETNKRAVPRAWNLADDLGQIEYLFSDKTGTLTENVMELRKCSIGGQVYGYLPSAVAPGEWDRMEAETIKSLQSALPYEYVPPTKFSFVDPLLFEQIHTNRLERDKIFAFFLALIICHTVLIDREPQLGSDGTVASDNDDDQAAQAGADGGKDDQGGEDRKDGHKDGSASPRNRKDDQDAPHLFYYKAQSPDEAALVAAARDLGFVFLGRKQNLIFVSNLGKVEVITVLHVLEFNSDRKRMSTIVRRSKAVHRGDGGKDPDGYLHRDPHDDDDGGGGGEEIILLCKGADNVIFDRLRTAAGDSPDDAIARLTQTQLELFAEDGLRTLCIAQRRLSPPLYHEWVRRYSEASAAMTNRELLTAALCDEIETDLALLGATAIEDRLQEGVPECIEVLQRAGIKIWVLTGDKMETAINIGFSCRLLHKRMVLLVIRGADGEETWEQLRSAYERIWSRHFFFGGEAATTLLVDASTTFALIIEGSTLKFALEGGKCRKLLLKLATKCTSVICCRVSPLQKATVVELVRKGRNAMTMAIGDGANDVSMIQAADVGVGIAGQEGMQAVMSSDYAIAQFRFLERLLLVHGRWAYIRTAEVIVCSLYKNVAFVVLLYWYQFYCGFTAQYIYDYMYLLFFNIFFSILPLLVLGFLERDLPSQRLLAVPQVYSLGIAQTSFSMSRFLLYLLDGLYQSVVCFFVPMLAYRDTAITWSGYPETQTVLGNIMAFSIIITTNLYMALNTLSWVAYSFVGAGLTILALVSFALLYSLIPSEALFGSWRNMIDPVFWGTLVLSVTLALTPRYLCKYVQTLFRPSALDIVREVEKYGVGLADLVRISASMEGETVLAADLGQLESIISCPPKAARQEVIRRRPLGLEIPLSLTLERGEDGGVGVAGMMKASDTRRRSLQPPAALARRRPGLWERSLALFNVRTNKFEDLRGFAFSQEEGMGGMINRGAGMAGAPVSNLGDRRPSGLRVSVARSAEEAEGAGLTAPPRAATNHRHGQGGGHAQRRHLVNPHPSAHSSSAPPRQNHSVHSIRRAGD